jgi:hypothetical protein
VVTIAKGSSQRCLGGVGCSGGAGGGSRGGLGPVDLVAWRGGSRIQLIIGAWIASSRDVLRS